MKRVMMLFVVVLLLTATVVYGWNPTLKGKAGDYKVELRFDTMKPITGVNKVSVYVADAAKKPVTDAKVEIEYFMTERVSATRKVVEMPYMQNEIAAVYQGPGYKAPLDFTMSGPWNIVIKIAKDGKVSKAKFHVNVK